MTIEVRELVIRAQIDERTPAVAGSSNASSQPAMSAKDMQKIVALCAEEVLKVLKRQKER